MDRRKSKVSSLSLLAFVLSLVCGASYGDPHVPLDHSLTRAQYEQLGLPPLNHAWTADERTKARSVLKRLAAGHPDELPRFASQTSGSVFAKIIDEESNRRGVLEGVVGSLPSGVVDRLNDAEYAQLVAGDTLQGIYAPQFTGGLIFDRELVQITSHSLAQLLKLRSGLQADLARSANLSSSGEELAAREAKLVELSDQLIVRTLATVSVFAVAEQFSPVGRSDATSLLVEEVPQIAPLLSNESQAKLRAIILQAATSPIADSRLRSLSGQP